MNNHLQFVISSIKNHSLSLKKTSILINKPWTLVDSDNEIQKIIFKKDKELILSKNGQATIGQWEYFPEARSILIDRGKDKILCNEAFIDDAVLILKLDGTSNDFFILANHNLIPDLDIYSYLLKQRSIHLNIKRVKLSNGKFLEVFMENHPVNYFGNHVLLDFKKVPDGIYPFQYHKLKQKFIVHNGRITSTLTEILYKTKEGQDIMIEQYSPDYFSKGDEVFINDELATDGKYKLDGFNKITVKDGKIIRKSIF